MPRHDFNCLKCNAETIVYTREKEHIDLLKVRCEYCHSDNVQLMAYYESDATQLITMQHEIQNLIDKVDAIIDKIGGFE